MIVNKRLIKIGIISLFLNVCIWCFSLLIIKKLGYIISLFDEEQFALIFSQIETGSLILPPFLIPFIIVFGIVFLLFRKNNNMLYIKLPLFLLVIILVQSLSIMCTCVNGLYFIDIIISLIKNLGGLGL